MAYTLRQIFLPQGFSAYVYNKQCYIQLALSICIMCCRPSFTTNHDVLFPAELLAYGFNEEVLDQVFSEVQSSQSATSWSLRGIPDHGFYQDLQSFMKIWPRSRMAAKTAIGEFYLAIDRNLRIRHSSTNAYQFIDRIVSLSRPRTMLMKYGVEDIETIKMEVKKYVEDRQKLWDEFEKMKRERDKAKKELHSTQVEI